MRLLRSLLLAWFSILILIACSHSQQAAVTISDAWSPVAPPGASVVAVYARIAVAADDVLLGVSTSVADMAELHSTSEEGGMMRMRPVARLEIHGGNTVQLQPRGMHLMLTGMHQALSAGDAIPLTFKFEQAGDIAVTAQVR